MTDRPARRQRRRRTSIWCWRPTTAGASASSIRAASARSIWCRRRRRTPTACSPGWGRSRWTTHSPWRLAAALAGKRTPIKAALLDQRVVAGLGNIYVCEALFRAAYQPAALGPHGRRRARGAPGAGDQGDADARRSRPAARRCATTCSRTANSAISSMPGRCTGARASRASVARGRRSAPASAASCSPAAARSIVRARSARAGAEPAWPRSSRNDPGGDAWPRSA